MLGPLRHTSSLRERFEDTREDQARSAFITAVARSPDTTMEELAREVAKHPELGDITLEQLLARTRRLRAKSGKSATSDMRGELMEFLTARGPEVHGFVVHPALPGLPAIRITSAARQRIAAFADDVANHIFDLLASARRRAITISKITIYAESLGAKDVAIDLRIVDADQQEAMWSLLARFKPRLPFVLWVGVE